MALLRPAGAVWLFPFLGVDRKWSESPESVAFGTFETCRLHQAMSEFDPSATSDLIDALTMQSNDRVQLPLGACGEQFPTARQTLELMRTPLGEFQPRARYQVRYHS